jgi:multiple sugar transport system permease protein
MKLNQKFVFVLPALLLIGIFVIFPIFETIRMSFTDWEKWKEVGYNGIDNYIKIFGDKDFINLDRFPIQGPPYGAMINTFLWTLIFIPVTAFIGLFLAVLLKDIKGGSAIKSLILLGMVTPMVIGGLMILFMYHETIGIVNEFLRYIGLGSFARTWTAYPNTALLSLILGSVWIWTGFPMILYSAGLEIIPGDIYESAIVDGASRWKVFWRITVPLLKPFTLIVVVMSLIWVLRVFDIVYVATLGGPGGASNVLALLAYQSAFLSGDFGSAAAIATFMTLIAAAITLVVVKRT